MLGRRLYCISTLSVVVVSINDLYFAQRPTLTGSLDAITHLGTLCKREMDSYLWSTLGMTEQQSTGGKGQCCDIGKVRPALLLRYRWVERSKSGDGSRGQCSGLLRRAGTRAGWGASGRLSQETSQDGVNPQLHAWRSKLALWNCNVGSAFQMRWLRPGVSTS